jgi:tetratricopeptide (TPR) repeat protein
MRMPSRLAIAAGLLAFATSIAAPAQVPESAGGQKQTNEDLIARGVELRKLGQDAEALTSFERANALRPSPRAVAQIALAHQALGHWREAERWLLQAMGDADDAWVARNRVHLEDSLAAVDAHLATLQVESNIPGAEVRIGGEPWAALPLERPMRIVAGEATIEVRAPGYAPIARTLLAEAKSQLHEVFTFVEQPMPTAHASGERAVSPPPRRHSGAAGWIALGGAGGLALLGVAGEATREWEAQIWNDDSRCGPTATQSRRERCGTNRDIGSAAETIGIAAFVGAGVSAAISGVLLFRSSASTPVATGKHVECNLAAARFACSGAF